MDLKALRKAARAGIAADERPLTTQQPFHGFKRAEIRGSDRACIDCSAPATSFMDDDSMWCSSHAPVIGLHFHGTSTGPTGAIAYNGDGTHYHTTSVGPSNASFNSSGADHTHGVSVSAGPLQVGKVLECELCDQVAKTVSLRRCRDHMVSL